MATTDPFSITNLHQQLDLESDRGAALLAASFITEALQRRLLEHFTHAKPGRELIESSNAPLAGLSAAARACRALDLISEEQYQRLLLIRQIRNDFAHTWSTVHFSSPGMQKTVNALRAEAGSLRAAFESAAFQLLRELGVPE